MEAPKIMPPDMVNEYSMGGEVPIEYSYRNDCSNESQQDYRLNYNTAALVKFTEMIKNGEVWGYGQTDIWMYEALAQFPIKDKSVCIVGSTNPWYEAMALHYGAKRCVVFEYAPREQFDSRIEYTLPEQIKNEKFDVCFSISSIEHDGLGRYGDPLDPNGDIRAMREAKEYVKKDGLMFLAIPVGSDRVYFNVHRVYGAKRLPVLLKGWNKLAAFGIEMAVREDDSDFFAIPAFYLSNNINDKNQSPYQPVFVLRNS
jgi:hypothetical protein